MEMLIAVRGDCLVLPRPWLMKEVSPIRAHCGSMLIQDCSGDLYVRGDAIVGERTVRLPYWHKVVWVGDVES